MGLIGNWIDRRYETAILASSSTAVPTGYTDPSSLPIATPWGSRDLERIVADDVFGGTDRPINTRAAAMRIPAAARARNLVVTSVAPLPLVQYRGAERVNPQPSWLTRPAPGDSTTPQHRMAWTLDDLIWYGWSCWWVDRGADTFPSAARRINQGDWHVDADLNVCVNGTPVEDPRNIVLIPGFHEGVLTYGRDSLDDTRALYRNVRRRLATPTAGLNLQETGSERPLTDDEIDTLIDRWSLARRGENGGVSFTSKGIQAVPMPGDDGALMIEARNAAAVDVARMIGVSAGLVDATTPKASLNYETKEGRNEELVDRDLSLYMGPVAARLSLDDVTPRGSRIAYDLSTFTGPQPTTGPPTED